MADVDMDPGVAYLRARCPDCTTKFFAQAKELTKEDFQEFSEQYPFLADMKSWVLLSVKERE